MYHLTQQIELKITLLKVTLIPERCDLSKILLVDLVLKILRTDSLCSFVFQVVC